MPGIHLGQYVQLKKIPLDAVKMTQENQLNEYVR